MHGRAKVISVFALSKVYYTARILTMTVLYAREFERDIWSFIWDDRQPLVKRSVCIGPVAKGGLNVPHLPSKSSPIQSIRRLFMDRTPSTWSLSALHWLRPTGIYRLGLAIFASEKWQPPTRYYSNMPTFYHNLIDMA